MLVCICYIKGEKMSRNKQDYELNMIDRFLYKMVIGLSLLVLLLIGTRYNIVSLEKVQNAMRQNINIVKIISYFNRPNLKLIPIDIEDTKETSTVVYDDYTIIDGGRRINVSSSVKNIRSGVVVKIEKKDTYKITVKSIDGYEYVYDNISNKKVNIYQYVKAGDIIGEVNNDTFNLYVYSKNGIVNLDDVLPV